MSSEHPAAAFIENESRADDFTIQGLGRGGRPFGRFNGAAKLKPRVLRLQTQSNRLEQSTHEISYLRPLFLNSPLSIRTGITSGRLYFARIRKSRIGKVYLVGFFVVVVVVFFVLFFVLFFWGDALHPNG